MNLNYYIKFPGSKLFNKKKNIGKDIYLLTHVSSKKDFREIPVQNQLILTVINHNLSLVLFPNFD